jgi:hypothetical protein
VLSGNKLSGGIGGLPGLRQLAVADLSNNLLQGQLPAKLAALAPTLKVG